MDANGNNNFVQQLEALYAEREELQATLGCSNSEDIVRMFRSFEGQLCDMYKKFGGMSDLGSTELNQVLFTMQQVGTQLDDHFAERSVVLEMEDDRPVLRAVWKNTTNQGD